MHFKFTMVISRSVKYWTVFLLAAVIMVISACESNPGAAGNLPQSGNRVPAEKLLAVDCLLPSQIRQLGRQSVYATARRPIKTTALDCEIRGGEYVAYDRADYRTALTVWLEKAKQGDAQAQTYLGEVYEKGLGLKPDYQAAFSWYSKAAKQGFSRAQINLGYLYEKGLGVQADTVTALNWYRKASGISDDIVYTSVVEEQAKTLAAEQNQRFKQEIERRDRQIEQLKSSLNKTRRQLKNRQQLLYDTKEKTLGLERRIEQQKKAGTDTAELVKAYQNQLQRVKQQTQAISALENQLVEQQEQLNRPSIEILEPPLFATRSNEPSLQVRSGSTAQVISGRITSQTGLKSATINGRSLSIDRQGLFHSAVPVSTKETRVTILATDNQGGTEEFVFVLIADDISDAAEQFVSTTGRTAGDIDFGRYYALVIGNNEYRNYPELKTAVNDARRVASLLESRYGFESLLITNADRYTVLSAINEIKGKLSANDNLLIYYAGHGEIEASTQQGYWLPVDAEKGNTANWISNTAITDLLNTIKARHIMVVADSCYSGSMTRSSIPRLNTQMNEQHLQKWLKLMTKTRSRTVLTSGGLGPVLDSGGGEHSVFARVFLNELETGDGVIDAYQIYRKVSVQVEKITASEGFNQIPTYAPIQHAGHGGGEFLLVNG